MFSFHTVIVQSMIEQLIEMHTLSSTRLCFVKVDDKNPCNPIIAMHQNSFVSVAYTIDVISTLNQKGINTIQLFPLRTRRALLP